jgi:GAF domain-containing protein
MAEQVDKVVEDFSDGLANAQNQAAALTSLLTRTLQALSKHNIQLAVDIPGKAHEMEQHLGKLEKQSWKVLRQLDQQKELMRTMALITSSLELNQVLAEVMDTVIHMTGAERAYLMLREHNGGGELTIRAARNWDRETMPQDDVIFSSSIVNAALEQQVPIITTNAEDDARFESKRSVVQHGLRSVVCIPLSLRGQVVGVLYADNRIEQGIFSNDDVPLLTAFGTQAAIAIENARQFGRVKDDLREAQRALQSLKIQIDRQKVEQQVSEITESEYFDRLAKAARDIRQGRRPSGE